MDTLEMVTNASEGDALANLTSTTLALWDNATVAEVLQDLEDALTGVCEDASVSEGSSFAALAGLHKMAPYSFLALSALIKPAISTFVFGPPRPKPLETSMAAKAKHYLKQGLQLCYLGLAASQTMSDVLSAWRAIHSDAQAFERVLAVAVILATSTNVQASFNAWALWYATSCSLAWAQSHSYLLELSLREFMGPMCWLYLHVMMWTYLALSLGLLLLASPVLLAYMWVSLPFVCLTMVINSFVGNTCVEVLPWYRGAPEQDPLVPASSLDEIKMHLKVVDEYAEMLDNVFDEETLVPSLMIAYEINMEMYRKTGMPARAWFQYFGRTTMIPPLVYVFVPVAARVYRGDWGRTGYMDPLWATLTERSFSAYLSCVGRALMAKLLFVWLWL